MRLNLTGRAARWSAAHWKTACIGWLAFVAVAVAIGTTVGNVGLTDAEQATGQTAQAEAILASAGFKQPAKESILISSRAHVTTDLAFRRTIVRAVSRLRTLHQVDHVHSPLDPAFADQLSKDRHSALVEFGISGPAATAENRVQPVLTAVAALQRASRGFIVAEFGDASASLELDSTTGKDFQRAEQLSLPLTFLILLLAFGAFVAAFIPVLLAFSAVLASVGLSELASHVWHASDAASSVILLIGMAVGVDYSLFYVKREREERRRGHGDDAVVRAGATSGNAVLISGGTVLIAMAGMLLSGSKIFTSIGISAMLVVACAMIGSLTVLPALLGSLGDRLDTGLLAVIAAPAARALRFVGVESRGLARLRRRRTWLQRLKGEGETSRLWDGVLRRVLRHPWLAGGLAAWALVVLALPLLSIHTKLPGFADLPRSIPVVRTYSQIQKAFPGTPAPAVVAVKAADVDTPAIRSALAALRRQALASGAALAPITTTVNPAHTVARVELPLPGNSEDAASAHALLALRSHVLPATLGRVPGVGFAVTGETAGNTDLNHTIKSRFPLVFAFVLGLAFLLLLLTFRSVVVPLTAIALNLLSVAASYGVLVWIFQQGHLQGLLGFHSNGAVVSWLPLFLFAVLFALSMDYHVFIVSRIKELADRGLTTEEAISQGIRTTAGTVTAAAAVMVTVFGIFASLQTLDIKQLGVGLAVAVLLDATVVRGVLLPATMTLLGRWNWYLPRGLGWLPRWGVEPARPAVEVD